MVNIIIIFISFKLSFNLLRSQFILCFILAQINSIPFPYIYFRKMQILFALILSSFAYLVSRSCAHFFIEKRGNGWIKKLILLMQWGKKLNQKEPTKIRSNIADKLLPNIKYTSFGYVLILIIIVAIQLEIDVLYCSRKHYI